MSFEPIDNVSNINKVIAYQYSESTNLIDYIGVLLTPYDELEQVFTDILNKRMFSTTTTDTLDTWGIILNQARESYDSNEILFFGLDATDEDNPVPHGGLGDITDGSIGAIFRSIEQTIGTVVSLNNADYRDILSGVEHKNNFVGGVEALIEAIKDTLNLTEKGSFQIEEIFTDPADPYVQITFYVGLSELQKSYIEHMNILPKPAGIRYEYIYT